ncbi:MAG: DUF4340 domain-containing protein [Kiritimatiellae bacterium]|nr:DUF4340 domain-containing protein [Kiritimatiellia bacterium]
MSNRRAILLLVLALVALVATDVLLDRDAGTVVRTGGRVTLVNPAWEVTGIRIVHNDGPEAVLAKTDEWRLTEPYAASVDESVVLRLLDALAFQPVTEAVSDAELLRLGRTRADFVLEDPVVRVTVSGDFGETTVSIGGPTPADDGVYAAVDGETSVLVVPAGVLPAVDVPADGFRRRSLFLIGPESVSAFDIKHGAGSMLVFSRSSDGWRMGEVAAASQKVQNFLSDLTAASAVDFVWPVGATNESDRASVSFLSGYGLDPDSAVTVTLKGIDGVVWQISFGKAADESRVYALAQNGSAVVTVPAALKDAAAQDAVMFTDSRLFPVDPQVVAFFSVTDGDVVYALARDDKGGWRIESPIAAEADGSAAEAMLARILSLSPSDADADGLGISLATNVAPVRVARSSVLDGGFERLRSCEMLRIDPKAVRRIVRTSGGTDGSSEAVVYDRERRAWNAETAGESGGTVVESGVESVLAAINPLTAERVVNLKVAAADLGRYGLDSPVLVIAIDQDRADAVRRNILIGGEAGDGRFATVGSADAVFVLSDSVVKALSAPLVQVGVADE